MSAATPLLLSAGLHASALRWPGKVALRCDEREFTYGELSQRVARVAGALRAAGIQRGDRIAIIAPNCAEYPEIVVGASDCGAIIATLSARSSAREVRRACEDCGARLLLAHPSVLSTATEAAPSCIEQMIVLGNEYSRWLDAATPSSPDPHIQDTDPFTLVYSSGTTGKPKGILISHRSRALTFQGMATEYGCYGPDDRQLGVAPMAHGAGFAFIMATLYTGGFVDILPAFDPERVLHALAQDAFTGVFLVPAHFHAVFAQEPSILSRYQGRFTTLRTIMSNASALPVATKLQILDYWGDGLLHETYGSTESGIVTNLRPEYQRARPRSVGPAFASNRIRLLDADGREVTTGEVGELYSSSPYLFSGYWNQPQESRAVERNGWVSAGDLARMDEDGFVYIVDRKHDMVVTGGFNVYPREIEDVLGEHPAVLESAVVGVPDERWGEALRAYVVLRDGTRFNPADLGRHCRASLANYKVPKDFVVLHQLPRNAGGKVLKKELRARHTHASTS